MFHLLAQLCNLNGHLFELFLNLDSLRNSLLQLLVKESQSFLKSIPDSFEIIILNYQFFALCSECFHFISHLACLHVYLAEPAHDIFFSEVAPA